MSAMGNSAFRVGAFTYQPAAGPGKARFTTENGRLAAITDSQPGSVNLRGAGSVRHASDCDPSLLGLGALVGLFAPRPASGRPLDRQLRLAGGDGRCAPGNRQGRAGARQRARPARYRASDRRGALRHACAPGGRSGGKLGRGGAQGHGLRRPRLPQAGRRVAPDGVEPAIEADDARVLFRHHAFHPHRDARCAAISATIPGRVEPLISSRGRRKTRQAPGKRMPPYGSIWASRQGRRSKTPRTPKM